MGLIGRAEWSQLLQAKEETNWTEASGSNGEKKKKNKKMQDKERRSKRVGK